MIGGSTSYLWLVPLACTIASCDLIPFKLAGDDPCLLTRSFPVDDLEPEERWQNVAEPSTVRQYHAVVSARGMVYAVGGYQSLVRESSAFEAYDPHTDSWTLLPQMPSPRHFLAAAATDSQVFAIGGIGNESAGDSLDLHPTVEVFNIDSGDWSRVADLPTPRNRFAAVAFDGLVYAIGGLYANGNTGVVEVYNPATDIWETRRPMPTPRHGHAATVIGGQILVVGGYSNTEDPTSVVEIFDPAKDRWMSVDRMPTPRGFLGLAAAKGYAYAIAGRGGSPFNALERFDPCLGTWRTLGTIPGDFRNRFGAATTDGVIWVVGGEYQGQSRVDLDMLRYDPDNSR
ncbi:MAG TPA: kelch repeat-containing protein [Rhodothermales bacterium]|nr:kelch repeat-containing protein [Rhodothermales bacterium]